MWQQRIQLISPIPANNKSDTNITSVYNEPDTVLVALNELPPLILSTALWKRYYYYLHFNSKELRPEEVQWLISRGLECPLPGLTLMSVPLVSHPSLPWLGHVGAENGAAPYDRGQHCLY